MIKKLKRVFTILNEREKKYFCPVCRRRLPEGITESFCSFECAAFNATR